MNILNFYVNKIKYSFTDYDIYEGIWMRSSDSAKIRCDFRFDGKLKCKWDEGGAQNVLEVTKTCLTWDKDSTVKGSYDNGSITWSNGSIWIKEGAYELLVN